MNTPQLLMLSGIGDREQLARHGIDVVADVPEVGQNMMDHLAVPLGFDVPDDSLYAAEKPLELLNYLFRRRGMLTSNVGEAYGFVRSRPDLDVPDLELIFAPAPFFEEGIGDPHDGHAVAMGPILVKPRSRGNITLKSADPLDKPIIDPQYLSDDAGADRAALISGLQMSARIARSPALSGVFGRIARPIGATGLNDETYRNGDQRVLADALPSRRDLPDGQRRRERGGSATAGPRCRRTAGGRCFGDARDRAGTYSRAERADRGEGLRPDPRGQSAAG